MSDEWYKNLPDDMKQAVDACGQGLAAMGGEMQAALCEQSEEHEAEIARLRSENERLRVEVEAATERYDQQVGRAGRAIARAEASERENEGLNGILRGLYRVFRNLAEDNRIELATVHEMVQADVDSIVGERIELTRERDAAQSELKAAGAVIHGLELRVTELEAECETAERERDEWKQAAERRSSLRKVTLQELADCRAERDAAIKAQEDMAEMYRECVIERDAAQEQYQNLLKAGEDQTAAFEAARAEVERLEQRIRDELANVEEWGRRFHDKYEIAAARNGWATQETTRTDFDDLPVENYNTMIDTVSSVFARLERTLLGKEATARLVQREIAEPTTRPITEPHGECLDCGSTNLRITFDALLGDGGE